MSLYLPEQKLGSHSDPGSSSHKFMLKGRQTGSMHRGHTWIFRAETHDTMMAWFHDIRELTEKRGEARNEFVRRTHARSISAGSNKAPSIASGDSQMDEDEADKIAFSGEQSIRRMSGDPAHEGTAFAAGGLTGAGTVGDDARSEAGWRPPQRPQPGGRFPSEVNVTRGLQAPLSPSSGDSGDEHDREILAAASALPGSAVPFVATARSDPPADIQYTATYEPAAPKTSNQNTATGYTAGEHARVNANTTGAEVAPDTQSQYHEWVGAAGAGAGAAMLGTAAVQGHEKQPTDTTAARDGITSESPVVAAPSMAAAAVPAVASTGVYHDVTSTEPVATANAEPPTPVYDNNLIGGTDIRSPAGLQYDTTKVNTPTAVEPAAVEPSVRPSPVHAKSVQTISDLHIPGEFPKSATGPSKAF